MYVFNISYNILCLSPSVSLLFAQVASYWAMKEVNLDGPSTASRSSSSSSNNSSLIEPPEAVASAPIPVNVLTIQSPVKPQPVSVDLSTDNAASWTRWLTGISWLWGGSGGAGSDSRAGTQLPPAEHA